MRFWNQLLLLAAVTLWGSGCASTRGYPNRVVSESAELPALVHYFTDDVIQTYQTSTNRRAYRDEVVMGRVRAVDLQFTQFERALNAHRNKMQVAADWAVLGLSGAGATAGGAAAKAVLAAISGGITGAKLSIDKTLFYEKTMPVLLQEMQASRTTVLTQIRMGLQSDLDAYSLMQALNDVDRYYEAGTLPGAMIALNSQTGQRNEAAKKRLNEVIEHNFSANENSVLLRDFWRPGGAVNAANRQDIRNAMTRAGLDANVEISELLNSERYVRERSQVVDILREQNKLP